MFTSIGLVLISLGWFYQLFKLKRGKAISPVFVIIYIIGVILLIADGIQSNLIELAGLNALSLAAALAVFLTITKGK
ncbi:MAG: hypothetical protein Q7R98_03130 [Candidatus Jorgensenbacteria bacterium]|nr:hypothetical protein [Candidatus Jorgensenbacteria bacterium]